MNSIEFLAIRKRQKDFSASDWEIAIYLDQVNASEGSFEVAFEYDMMVVADEGYEPEGKPKLPSWCSAMDGVTQS